MEICLYNDVAFKWIFGRQERTVPIVSLLNAVIGYESSETLFGEIRILNPFDISRYSGDRRGVLDLRVKDDLTGAWADVEVQVAYQEFYPKRSMFYLAGLYRDQMAAGQNYTELKPCYGVHILMADLFEDEPNWYNCYRMLNMKTHKVLSRDWALYYVELGKFRKASAGKGDGDVAKNLRQWCDFLSVPHESTEPLDESSWKTKA